jgi:hypothetical protein
MAAAELQFGDAANLFPARVIMADRYDGSVSTNA